MKLVSMGGVLLVAALSVMLCAAFVVLSRMIPRRSMARYTVGCAALCCYTLANLYVTVLSRKPSETAEPIFDFLSSYVNILVQEDGSIAFSEYWFAEVTLNWLMFVPLGCLLTFTWSETFVGRGLRAGIARSAVIGFALSLVTELMQLVLKVGFFELDDLLNNTMGCVLGYLMYRSLVRFVEAHLDGRRDTSHGPSYTPRHMAR